MDGIITVTYQTLTLWVLEGNASHSWKDTQVQNERVHVDTYVYDICIFVCIYTHTCIQYVYVYICIYIYAHVYIYVYVYVRRVSLKMGLPFGG